MNTQWPWWVRLAWCTTGAMRGDGGGDPIRSGATAGAWAATAVKTAKGYIYDLRQQLQVRGLHCTRRSCRASKEKRARMTLYALIDPHLGRQRPAS